MTAPYEHLLSEELPTGTFGHALPPRPTQPHQRPAPHWSPTQQAQHRADLLAGIDGWTWDDDQRDTERRHLQLITHTETAA